VRYSFTGKELDDSGLHYFSARYYDSNLGRFTTTDPVADNHAYVYVSNNPMNFVDPSGMEGALIQIPADDWNGAFSHTPFLEVINELKEHYDNVEVVTISNAEEYEASFKDFYNKHGLIDFFVGGGHGAETVVGMSSFQIRQLSEIFLTNDNHLTIDFFKSKDFSMYFSDIAKGIRFSCHAANNCGEETNVAQAEANALGIPLQAFTDNAAPGHYKLNSHLELEYIGTKKQKFSGFDENGYAKLDIKGYNMPYSILNYNNKMYFIDNQINKIFISNLHHRGISISTTNIEINNPKYKILAPVPINSFESYGIHHYKDVIDVNAYAYKILTTVSPK